MTVIELVPKKSYNLTKVKRAGAYGIGDFYMDKRDNSIDLLRIVASVFVIAIHVSGPYDLMMHDGSMAPSFLLSFMMNMTDCGVSIFLVITGAFLLANDRYASFKTFYKHSAQTIAIPTLIFSIYYIAYSIIPSAMMHDSAGIRYEILETLQGRPFFHMWYLYTLLCIHLFIPAIIRLRQMLGETAFERIAILIFISSTVSDMTSSHMLQYDPGSAYRYVGYVFAGYVIYKRSRKNNLRGIILLLASFLFLMIGSIARYMAYSGNDLPVTLNTVLRIMVILCPLLMFGSMAHFKIDSDMKKLSGLCFYIYLFHAGVLDLITRIASIMKAEDRLYSLLPAALNIMVLTLIIFLISLGLSVIYDMLQRKVEDRLHIRQRMYKCLRRIALLFISSNGYGSP